MTIKTDDRKTIPSKYKHYHPQKILEGILEETFKRGVRYGEVHRLKRAKLKSGKNVIMDYTNQCVWTQPVPFKNLFDDKIAWQEDDEDYPYDDKKEVENDT